MSDEQEESADSAELRKRAAENTRAVRAAADVADKTETNAVLETIQRMAERATGLTRDELLASADAYTEPGPVVRVIDPRKEQRRLMTRANAPERHIQNVADSGPVECDALDAVREFMASDRYILALSGGIGTRKTGSACWALGQREGGVFVKAKHLSHIAIEDKAMYLRLSRSKLVVLDELGLERADEKGYWLSTFVDLFDDWYANCAKVIITGNITREQFKAYDERVYDRLREVGTWQKVAGESMRGGAK